MVKNSIIGVSVVLVVCSLLFASFQRSEAIRQSEVARENEKKAIANYEKLMRANKALMECQQSIALTK